MKSFPFQPGADPLVVGESLIERGWTLPDVLEWFAGTPCNRSVCGSDGIPCPYCFAYPAAEYGRDVLTAFIMAGGYTHLNHVKMVVTTKSGYEFMAVDTNGQCYPVGYTYRGMGVHESLVAKRHILRLFSGPVDEDGGVRIRRRSSDNGIDPVDFWEEITPEQLLPSPAVLVNCIAHNNESVGHVNAADYGVSEDNPDNTEALQRAVDAATGGIVNIRSGRYMISRPIPFPRPD